MAGEGEAGSEGTKKKRRKEDILINRASCRRKIQSLKVGCSFEVFQALEKILVAEIEKGVARAVANKRKTLKARDIIVI